ncbi:MAG TPA: branched-chain amino acid ABC transporter permease [Solirubrobacteraceae bacterium]|nr:branched-chain amino acid ABC transporter permease [Solirubrobacteraceae bacterium]
MAVEPKDSPGVGVDEWVARSGERREYLPGWRGDVQRAFERVGWWPRLGLAAAVGVFIPLVIGLNSFQTQVGIDALLLAILALGLNVSVGWAGLLDLGYIAFYGFGAYGFALLSSSQLNPPDGVHWPAYFSIPLVMIAAAVLGLCVGWPSRRLIGDYLAIVTLFFGEAFVEFTNNVAPKTLGGPNGIFALDPLHGVHVQILTPTGYFYVLLALLVASMAVLHMLDTSRMGRAWRAVREDPLAASAMTIPVNRVKLMAFAIGAMIAAMAGAVFAAQQTSVFPTDFDTPYLILIYAGLILGGAGSMSGAVIGGLLVSIVLDGFLRSPTQSSYIFYGVILVTLLIKLRPWARVGLVIGGTVAFGFVVHAIVAAFSSTAVAGASGANDWIDLHWAIVPANPITFGNICFVALLCMVVVLAQVRHPWRTILFIPTLFLAACAWEARLSQVPAITRLILLGAILIVVMNWRPAGLLGARRVEIV